MARRVAWARRATLELVAIADYIAQDSPNAASRFAKQTLEAARSLREMPERGRRVAELEPMDLRELLVGSYRLIYRIESDIVSIAAIVHGARDLAALWEREER